LKRRLRLTQEQVESFVSPVRELLDLYLGHRIVNIDETNWKTIAAGFLTWATREAESVNCHIDNNEKHEITVLASHGHRTREN
jgi:hypothetical protein